MLFIGAALMIAVGLATLISGDIGAAVGLNEAQIGQLVPLVIVCTLLAAGLFSRRQRLGAMLGNLLTWGALFAVAVVGYTYRAELQGVADRVMGEFSPNSAVIDSEGGAARFRRGLDGHFTVAAAVNGIDIPLLFDTGASAVVLTYEDAERAGLEVDTLSFTLAVTTANGVGQAALTRLARIEVGGIARRDIRAFVAERNALHASLLGMSFLETLSGYSVSGSRLELSD